MLKVGDCITIAGGHGGNVGARGLGYKEEELTEKLAIRLTTMLCENGYKAYNVTPSGNLSVGQNLKFEVDAANKYNAKLHICFHFNAFNGQAHGTETYILAKGGQAEKFATEVNNALVDFGYYNRGVKTKSFYVLKNTVNPAILVEICFIDNEYDMAIYNAEKVARVLYKALTGKEYVEPRKDTTFYRVICGSFNSKENADKRKRDLENKGFKDIFIEVKK